MDGLLYYVRHKGQPNCTRAKVLCGQEEANNVFIDCHASSHGAHCGQKKTREAISLRFYWPGMSDDIHQWVSMSICFPAFPIVCGGFIFWSFLDIFTL